MSSEAELEATVRALRAELAAVIAQRDAGTQRVCDAMQKWQRCVADKDPDAGDEIASVFLMIHKSNLLFRLLYGEEQEPRREKCPKHKGRWSGIPTPENNCPCHMTGWLPNQEDVDAWAVRGVNL